MCASLCLSMLGSAYECLAMLTYGWLNFAVIGQATILEFLIGLLLVGLIFLGLTLDKVVWEQTLDPDKKKLLLTQI